MPRTTIGFLVSLLLAAVLSAPAFSLAGAESSGSVREVSGFDKVEIGISGEVILTQGTAESLEIVASAEDLARISTVVRMGTLRIGAVRPNDSPRGRVTYRLTMKTIAALTTNSSGSFTADRIDAEGLTIAVHSSGSVTVGSLSARTLVVEISSSGGVTVAGTIDRQTLRSSSSGEYRAENLACREAVVELSSSGRATVNVTDALTGKISSSGDIRYRGGASKVIVNASSSGRLVKLD